MKNISGGDNLVDYVGIVKEEKPKRKPRVQKKEFTWEDEKSEWNKDLSDFRKKVEKSYDKFSIKEKYDLISCLVSAQNCLK